VRGRTWAEIELGALLRNLAWIRSRSGERRVIAVVKANAYGHGAVAVARSLVEAGVDALAVATPGEARELRRAGLEGEILLLSVSGTPEEADAILSLRLVPLVGSPEAFEALDAAAARAGIALPVHLKVDTGMGRLGVPLPDLDGALDRLSRATHLELGGFASHLADADDPSAPTVAQQRERFAGALARVRERGLAPAWVHMDNSAGIVHGPTDGTNAVRPGLALYGADPTLERACSLEPVMTLVTRVLQQKRVPAGTRVGYGGAFTASRETQILTLPIGYADGLPRAAGGRFSVGLGGRLLPIVGRVSMDFTTVDAGPAGTVEVGQELLVFGRKGGLTIGAECLADAVGTIAYEILVGIGVRVPRVLRDEERWASRGSESGRTRDSRSAGA
jgi:alanine racemase